MRPVLLVISGAALLAALLAALSGFNAATEVRQQLSDELLARGEYVASSTAARIAQAYGEGATSTMQRLIERTVADERIVGYAVFGSAADPIVSAGALPAHANSPILGAAMQEGKPRGGYMNADGEAYYIYATPLPSSGEGAVVVVEDAQFVDDAVRNAWRDTLIRFLSEVVLFGAVVVVFAYWVFLRSIARLVDMLREFRRGNLDVSDIRGARFLEPLASEISKVTQSLRQARRSASEEARMRLEKLDSPWTTERLKEFVKAQLKDRQIFVLSNGEPYINTRSRGQIEWATPAGGVVTAVEAVMEACGGIWVAHGSGAADKEVADESGKLAVPPEEPKYTLKRIWLSPKEVKGYYDGFSNEALWPLCHMAHVRPVFRRENWAEYVKVNGLFAKTLLEEVRDVERPIVLVQDYHLALVPALIKRKRPDAQVALFWHIPWPSAAQFSICPWRKELLEGMLGADLVGFHTQQYCNNFMDTVGNEIESRIDLEYFSIFKNDHQTFVKPFPVSIAFPGSAEANGEPDRKLLGDLGINVPHLALGVDRLDYIKGIPERFRAVEMLLKTHPEYRGTFTLLQIASPTRGPVEAYQRYAEMVAAEAERVNAEYGTPEWKPIVLERRTYSHKQLRDLYRFANVCLVTSLHDGMNLVAKEYAAARADESGVLILSQFAGASRGLKGAIIVNPYSAEQTAAAMHSALAMPKSEQHRRMKALRAAVRDYNIYRWAAELLRALLEMA